MSETLEIVTSVVGEVKSIWRKKKMMKALRRSLLLEVTGNLNLIGNVNFDIDTANAVQVEALKKAIQWLIRNFSNEVMNTILIAEDDHLGVFKHGVGDSESEYTGRNLSESIVFCYIKINELKLVVDEGEEHPNKVINYTIRIRNLKKELLNLMGFLDRSITG
jgi:hypothetical protein